MRSERFRVCGLVHLREGVEDAEKEAVRNALIGAARRIEGVVESQAEFDLPGSIGGGHLTWDFQVADKKALLDLERAYGPSGGQGDIATPALGEDSEAEQAVERVDAAVLETIQCETTWKDFANHPESIKRTNFVRVRDDAPPAEFMRWLRDTPRLVEYVPAIKNWCFSRVRGYLGPTPPIAWTHCWEQEFATPAGLHEDYMLSPYHWGHLDGYYDLENPRCIMDPDLTHLFCPARHSVLSAG